MLARFVGGLEYVEQRMPFFSALRTGLDVIVDGSDSVSVSVVTWDREAAEPCLALFFLILLNMARFSSVSRELFADGKPAFDMDCSRC